MIWMGLGSAILLHGAYDAFLFTGSGYAVLAILVLFIEVHWGRKLYKALQAEQVVGPASVVGPMLAVPVATAVPLMMGQAGALVESVAVEEPLLLAQGSEGAMGSYGMGAAARSSRRSHSERTSWSWIKLAMGGLGLSLCGIWWLAVIAVIFFPDASREPLETAGQVGLIIVSMIPTLLCLGIFRSGLRGPFELAPD
jgi:protease PrsW